MRKLDDDRRFQDYGAGKEVKDDLDMVIRKLLGSESGALSTIMDLDEEDAIVGTFYVIKLAQQYGKYVDEVSGDLIAIRKNQEDIYEKLTAIEKRLDAIKAKA